MFLGNNKGVQKETYEIKRNVILRDFVNLCKLLGLKRGGYEKT